MGTGIDFMELLWNTCYDLPLLLTYLVGAGLLIARRRVAPRACIVAACVCLVMFMQYFATIAAVEAIKHQLRTNTYLSLADCLRFFDVLYISTYCLSAVCFGTLAWCILMGRPEPPTDE